MFGEKEGAGDDSGGDMMMPANKGAPLVITQARLVFQVLIGALSSKTLFQYGDEALELGVRPAAHEGCDSNPLVTGQGYF